VLAGEVAGAVNTGAVDMGVVQAGAVDSSHCSKGVTFTAAISFK
jgi:hypothetical protein